MSSAAHANETLQNLIQRTSQGDLNACARLGRIYAVGDECFDVKPNRALAEQYYGIGAQAGDLHCTFGLARTILADDTPRAVQLLETCAKGKYIWALAALGDLYIRGKYVQKDNNKAFQYLREYTALCRPDKVGQNTFKVRWDLVLYPTCLLLGVGCEKDEKKAREVLTELAAQGNLSAADILASGQLSDWMAAKRFNFDTKANGPVTLFAVAGQKQNPVSKSFATKAKPRIHKTQEDHVDKQHLSRFLQRAVGPDETILMHARFPRIYVTETALTFFFFLVLGRFVEHFLAVNGPSLFAGVPDFANSWLFTYPEWPVVIAGIYGGLYALRRMIRKWTTEIVLTNSRFIYKHGFFSVEMIQMNFWQIQHSDVTQSILGSWLDYGSVHVESYSIKRGEDTETASGMLQLPAIAHPFLFSRLIEDNRQLPYKNAAPGMAQPIPVATGQR
jgi:hypothetical protein